MSIAAVSSAFAPLAPAASTIGPVAAVEPVPRTAPVAAHDEGRRRELVNATAHALGVTQALNMGTEQAVFRFAHALMYDLRTVAGQGDDGASTTATVPQAWNDLPQRLSTLATAAAQPAAAATPDLPDTPNPLTPATAAVHIMKVPTSRLLEAFVSLQRAMGLQVDAATPAQSRSALAEMAQRLASAAAASGSSDAVASGKVLDVRA
jgi:hypothetical protein